MVERTLHAALLTNPRRPVDASEIAAMADKDARENWTLMIAFRDLLLAQRTIEAAYLHLVRTGFGATPPLFVNQLVHAILRNLLDDCEDVYALRAAEMFFRPQRLTTHEGSLIAADEETVAGTNAQVGLAAGLHARPAGGGRHRRAQRRQRARATGSAATASTWRSISPPAGVGSPRSAR